jgi:hypothetical protein
MTHPLATEAAPYYSRYIDLIPSEDVISTLTTQLDETINFLNSVSEEQSLHAYAPDKWTLRQVLSHINDTERVFLFRAFWFARGAQEPLAGFDQDIFVGAAKGNDVSWSALIEEFRSVRQSTLTFFKNSPPDSWTRRGVASENPVTVRAIAYIIAGHLAHHIGVIKDRYLGMSATA